MNIVYKPLPVHITKCTRIPKYIVIHYTAGSNSRPGKAQSMYNTFISRNASADYAIDDRDIVQFNHDILNYYCWAVGGKKQNTKGGSLYGKANNKNTISIELCSTCIPATSEAVNTPNHTGWSFTEATVNNAVELVKMLMHQYNIPIENVIRHYDITGKLCPGIAGWNDEDVCNIKGEKLFDGNSNQWLEFKKRLL